MRVSMLRFALKITSYCIPKKERLWVFYPTHYNNKFEGNIKAVFEYVLKNRSDIEVFCIGAPREIILGNNKLLGRAESSKLHPRSIWNVLRAETIFVDKNNYFFFGNFNVIDLWHGTGFKNIRNLRDKKKKNSNYYSEFLLSIAGSINDQKRKAKAFCNENIYVVGNPRNDFLWRKLNYKIPGYKKIITYAPTFRDYEAKPFSKRFIEELQGYLHKNNYLFLIQKHPKDKCLSAPIDCPNIRLASDFTNDVQELLKNSDILISDYSSISVDFALLKRPIIFYMYDCSSEFLRNGFYYDLNKVLPGPFVYREQDLLEKIKNIDWFYEKEYQEKYNEFVDFFHQYQDDKASARVTDLVISKMRNR